MLKVIPLFPVYKEANSDHGITATELLAQGNSVMEQGGINDKGGKHHLPTIWLPRARIWGRNFRAWKATLHLSL
jgi:hypothetical protein